MNTELTEVESLNVQRTHLARVMEAHRRVTVRVQGLAQALDAAEQGGATVMRIEHVRTLMDLPRVPAEVSR